MRSSLAGALRRRQNEISGKGSKKVYALTVDDQRVSGVQPKLLLVQGQLQCLHIGHYVPPSRVGTIGEKLQNQIFGVLIGTERL